MRYLDGSRARKHVAEFARFYHKNYGHVLWGYDNDGICGCAVLIHALNSVRVREVAIAYRNNLQMPEAPVRSTRIDKPSVADKGSRFGLFVSACRAERGKRKRDPCFS